MSSVAALELLGLGLALLGWAGAVVATALPMWRVPAFVEGHLVVAQSTWEGLWMACVVQSTGQLQCKVFDSLLALGPELQAGRALMVASALLALPALLLSVAGAACTTCLRRGGRPKAWAAAAGGGLFAFCGLLALVPPSWLAHLVVRAFHDPQVPPQQKRELGPALFLAWAAAALLMLGGALVAAPCARPALAGGPRTPSLGPLSAKYAAPPRGAAPTDAYDKKNYV